MIQHAVSFWLALCKADALDNRQLESLAYKHRANRPVRLACLTVLRDRELKEDETREEPK